MNDFNFGFALVLFLVALVLDAVAVLYTYSITNHNSVRAGLLSASMYLLGALGIVGFIDNKLYLIPLALGAFTGAFLIVERDKRKTKKTRNE